MPSLQWTLSTSSRTSFPTAAAPLSVSQLLRIERHRGFASSLERPRHRFAHDASLSRHQSLHSVRRTSSPAFPGAHSDGCKPCVVSVQARPSTKAVSPSQHPVHCGYTGTTNGGSQRRHASKTAIPSLPTLRDPLRIPSSPRKPSTPQDGSPSQGPLFRKRYEDNTRTEFPKSGLELDAERRKLARAKLELAAARERARKERIAQLVRNSEARFVRVRKAVADTSSTSKALAEDIRNFHHGVREKVLDVLGNWLDRLISDSSVYGERVRELRASIDQRRLKQMEREVLAFETENDHLLEKKYTHWVLERRCTASAVYLAEDLWQYFADLFMRAEGLVSPDRPNRYFTRNYMTRQGWYRPDGSKFHLRDLQLFKSSGLTTGHQKHLRDKAILGMFLLFGDLNLFETRFMKETHSLRRMHLNKRHYQHHPTVFAHEIDSTLVLTILQDLHEASRSLCEAFWYHFEHLGKRQTVHRTQFNSEDNLNASAKQQRMNDLSIFVSSDRTALDTLTVNLLQLRTLRRALHGGLIAKQHALLAIHFNNFMSYRVTPTDHEQLEKYWLHNERHLSSPRDRQVLAAIKQHYKLIQEEVRPLWLQFDSFLYYNWLATERSAKRDQMITAAWEREMRLLKHSSGLLRSASDEVDYAPQHPVPNFRYVNSRSLLWQYTDFQGPDGKILALDYCVNSEAADAMAARLAGKSVLGIDLWAGQHFASLEEAIAKGNSARRAVPMLALASDEHVTLFHLAAMEDPRPLRPPGEIDSPPLLTRILESRHIVKVGEDINSIREKLQNYCGVDLRAYVDVVDSTGKGQQTEYSGQLTKLIREHTGKSLPEMTHDMSPIRQKYGLLGRGNDLKVFATRPYAALWLYHKRFDVPQVTDSKLALARTAGASNQTQPTGSHEHQPTRESNGDELLNRSLLIAASDFGLVTVSKISPKHEAYRDWKLSELSRDLAEALRASQPKEKLPLQDFKIYVLLTRFGQSFDDIRRIFRITLSPTELRQKFGRYHLPIEQGLAEELFGSLVALDPIQRADDWLDELLRDRQSRQVKRGRTALRAYAMWHKQGSLTIAEIAGVFDHPGQPEYAFKLIKRALLYMTWLPKSRAKTRQLFERFEPEHAHLLLGKMRFAPSPTLGAWGQGLDVVDLPRTVGQEETRLSSENLPSEIVPGKKIAAPSLQAPSVEGRVLRPGKTSKLAAVHSDGRANNSPQQSLARARIDIRRAERRLKELGPDTAAARMNPAATSLRRKWFIRYLHFHEWKAEQLAKMIATASGHSMESSPPAIPAEMSKSEETDASESANRDRLHDGHLPVAAEKEEHVHSSEPRDAETVSDQNVAAFSLPMTSDLALLSRRVRRLKQGTVHSDVLVNQNVQSTVQKFPRRESADSGLSGGTTATKNQVESRQSMQDVDTLESSTRSQAQTDGPAGKYSNSSGTLYLEMDASQAASEHEVSASTGESSTVDEEEALFRKLEEELAISAEGGREVAEAGAKDYRASGIRKVKAAPALNRAARKERLARRQRLRAVRLN